MADVLLFGGTAEGRELAEALRERGVPALVSVATEYGESLLEPGGGLRVRRGALDEGGMAALMAQEAPRAVIDATHPYAEEVSRNLRAACGSAGIKYLRVVRERAAGEGFTPFGSLEELIPWLDGRPGVIFSTLGAKEAAALAAVPGAFDRVWLRVLPRLESLAACLDAGFPAKHIICMQGPFSEELNAAMFKAAGADILVTKETGAAGGFPEKLAAAKRCGMSTAVIVRPKDEHGVTVSVLKKLIEEGGL